jgi:hypothetical protein
MQTLKKWKDLPEISRLKSENVPALSSKIVVPVAAPVLKIALWLFKMWLQADRKLTSDG